MEVERGMQGGRARAWVLVQAKSAHHVAKELYEQLVHEGGDRFVVIRADVIDHSYNVMIPVDAESQQVLEEVHGMIREHPGVIDTAVIHVKQHVPFPPHDAQGYVTDEEAEVGKERIPPGRQGASPGANPWG
jgi:hypothetical protein